jgi:hypothetical protein
VTPATPDPDAAWRFALGWLRRPVPGGAFEWKPGGPAAVGRYLERAMKGPEAVAAVGGLLRLTSALRRRLASPAAADALAAVLRATPGVLPLVRRHWSGDRGRRTLQRFHAALGEAPAARAPKTGAAAGPGALPLRQLIDPQERDRRRAKKS